MQTSITDLKRNLQFNRNRWGRPWNWSGKDHYGYRWSNGNKQGNGDMAAIADRFLRPYLPKNRYDLSILELSPGAGRFTCELIRLAGSLDLLDMNRTCLDICRKRFRYQPVDIGFYLNDGRDCSMLPRSDYDLIACFDSMVHMHPDIIRGYVQQLGQRLASGGILWLDHSGKGTSDSGHRTDMTPETMAEFAREAGLRVVAQPFRNSHDCISILAKG